MPSQMVFLKVLALAFCVSHGGAFENTSSHDRQILNKILDLLIVF